MPPRQRSTHRLRLDGLCVRRGRGHRRDGRADVRALRIVVEPAAADLVDELDAMGQPAERRQRGEQRRFVEADGACECKRGERVRGVVQAGEREPRHGESSDPSRAPTRREPRPVGSPDLSGALTRREPF